MAQLNTNLPVPSADGVGAWVDVSAFGALKTILCSGDADAVVTIEISNAAVANDASAAPLVGFQSGKGKATIACAARWMRVRVGGFNAYVGGSITVDVSGTDDGTEFATLAATARNGTGAGVDISALKSPFKTIHVGNAFRGALQIEASNDAGVTWTQLVSFDTPGQKSKIFSAQFLRTKRNGVPQNSPGLPVINVGLCDGDGGGGGGGGGGDLGWYGTGVDGDHVTAGDEAMTRDMYYNDLTISAGDTFSTAGFKLAVAGTLTIESGGVLDNSGDDGVDGGAGAPAGTLLGGGDGGAGLVPEFGAAVGVAGESTSWWPVAETPGGGGDGGAIGGTVGGAGGSANLGHGAGPYTIEQIASGDGVGGGAGGGSGAVGANPSTRGIGGGGGGVMVLKVRAFDVADDNSIRARGGDGYDGEGTAAGGGGGQGGVVLIITDDSSVPVCDVSGGAGGAGVGGGAAGTAGDDGVVIAISPIHGPL